MYLCGFLIYGIVVFMNIRGNKKRIILISLIILVGILLTVSFIASRSANKATEVISTPGTFEETGTRLEGVVVELPEISSPIELRKGGIVVFERGEEILITLDSELERSFISNREPYVIAPVSIASGTLDDSSEKSYLLLFKGSGSDYVQVDEREIESLSTLALIENSGGTEIELVYQDGSREVLYVNEEGELEDR